MNARPRSLTMAGTRETYDLRRASVWVSPRARAVRLRIEHEPLAAAGLGRRSAHERGVLQRRHATPRRRTSPSRTRRTSSGSCCRTIAIGCHGGRATAVQLFWIPRLWPEHVAASPGQPHDHAVKRSTFHLSDVSANECRTAGRPIHTRSLQTADGLLIGVRKKDERSARLTVNDRGRRSTGLSPPSRPRLHLPFVSRPIPQPGVRRHAARERGDAAGGPRGYTRSQPCDPPRLRTDKQIGSDAGGGRPRVEGMRRCNNPARTDRRHSGGQRIGHVHHELVTVAPRPVSRRIPCEHLPARRAGLDRAPVTRCRSRCPGLDTPAVRRPVTADRRSRDRDR